MTIYHEPALAGNNPGLPKFGKAVENPEAPAAYPSGLSAGGRMIFERTRRCSATCNLLARLAGIGQEVDYVV